MAKRTGHIREAERATARRWRVCQLPVAVAVWASIIRDRWKEKIRMQVPLFLFPIPSTRITFALLLQLLPFRTSDQPLGHIAGNPPPSLGDTK